MRTKVLITVKTYPTLSDKYGELVCTAGFREDLSWIRVYPVPFRKLEYERRYRKYEWLELDIERNLKDPRPESYYVKDYETMTPCDFIDPKKGGWEIRKKYVLHKVYDDMNKLILEAKDKNICTSLATFKPKKKIDFVVETTAREWDKKKVEALDQLDLFKKYENPFKVVNKLPYKFSYVFEDIYGKTIKLMIEDWEIGQLYWNCLRGKGSEKLACEDVKKKYFDNFAKTKDLYFFLGTTRQYHFMAKNPFIIIGVFYPPYGQQNDEPQLSFPW
ncbi:MAG: hypothetical protein GY754_02225 [bacterium]|nr:hypothetical protein [bacterium]